MKKSSIIKFVSVVILFLIIILSGCNNTDATKDVPEKLESEKDNVEANTEKDTNDESASKETDSISSALDSVFEEFEKGGNECKSIEDMIDRGDCFQEVNSSLLSWYIDESKELFYFPYLQSQEHWEEVFYFTINESEELSDIQKAEFYDSYLEISTPVTDINFGEEVVKEHWYVFSNIIPNEYREDLTKIYWTYTGEDYVFAVGRDKSNIKDMRLVVSHNTGEYQSISKNLLIHEFAHILTKNEGQVQVDEEIYLSEDESVWDAAAAECPTFFSWGCMEETSYMYQFYQEFWEDIYSEHEQIDWESEEGYKNFFYKYEDRFFRSYAGTSPVEDIADSFTNYIFTNSTELDDTTEMKYDKLEFFYQYDELVELRTMILENIYDLVLKDKTFY